MYNMNKCFLEVGKQIISAVIAITLSKYQTYK